MRLTLLRTTALTIVLSILAGVMPLMAFADEGMFLPDTVSSLPFRELQKRGLKVPLTEIYNPAGVSIKDAVVIVGGGTGEFVSPEGLILTNHHVAFDALVAASDAANDYGKKGFTAKSRAEELPAQNFTVTITQDLKDVTNEVLSAVTPATTDRNAAIRAKIQALESAGSKEGEGIQVRVMALNEGLLYYQFTYLILRDVRIAYAPPKSIGFFGGDPDNFEWPRHCGDFAFMRAYVAPDGKPAAYSTNNVPFKPKKFLTLSLGGVKEKDFVMVMGYPGSTRRYRESYSVAYNQDISLPFQVDLLSRQIEILEAISRGDEAARVRLQGTIFDLANALKNFEGSVLAMRRANLVERKRKEEADFTRWVNEDPARKEKFGEVLPTLEKAYSVLTAKAHHDTLVPQLFNASTLVGIAMLARRVAVEKEKPEANRNPALGPAVTQRVRSQLAGMLEDRNTTLERELFSYLLLKAAELPAGQKVEAVEKRFGSLQGEARRRAEEDFARAIIDSKRFSTVAGLSELFDLSVAQMKELREPLVDFVLELGGEFERIQTEQQTFNATVLRWRPLLLEAMKLRGGVKYPDANRTLRFSYGEVRGYFPREATSYAPFTTLAGVIEKDTGREPFDVPEKLKQLFRAGDYGIYGQGNSMPVDFISTADIIGGNSGSPILNGRGEQVGIIFDGNYEGLGNDFFYNDTHGRAIAVDIRYVLFITDKFGGAGWILKELDVRDSSGKKRKLG